MPKIISELADGAKQETKFAELMYGAEHGSGRYGAIPLFGKLRRGNPDLYTVAFVLGT